MKRLHFGILLLCALLLLLPMSAFAAGDEAAQLFYVTDEVGILKDTEHNALEEKAAKIAAAYEFSPYIIVVEDYRDYNIPGDIF